MQYEKRPTVNDKHKQAMAMCEACVKELHDKNIYLYKQKQLHRHTINVHMYINDAYMYTCIYMNYTICMNICMTLHI